MSNEQAKSNVLPIYAENGNYVLTSMLRDTEERLAGRDKMLEETRDTQRVLIEELTASRELCGRMLLLFKECDADWMCIHDDSPDNECIKCRLRAVIAEAEIAQDGQR